MTDSTDGRSVLVSAGSKHGATEEIAQRIAKTIEAQGGDVRFLRPDAVDDLERFDVVVLGSAVYAGHWTPDARALAERVSALEPRPVVWLFSSGPVGDPLKPAEDPVDVSAIREATGAREHRVFAGKIDKSRLGFGERAIVMALKAPEGDFRDWDDIDSWARDIAETLPVEVKTT